MCILNFLEKNIKEKQILLLKFLEIFIKTNQI